MNNPFDYIPDRETDEAFKELLNRISKLKNSGNPEDIMFYRELEEGKMIGVLIASDKKGGRRILYAFSGQIGDSGFYYPGFVEPAFDYLQPNGYFRTQEERISYYNREISEFERNVVVPLRMDYSEGMDGMTRTLEEYKEIFRMNKQQRDEQRKGKNLSQSQTKELIRQSQFDKAEFKRIRKRLKDEILPLEERWREAENRLREMKERRRRDSEELQKWLFSQFMFKNAKGESKSLIDIFKDTSIKVPPSGAGECCAPKLLQAAYLRGWKPVAIAEYWFGKSKNGEVRLHGSHYPACRGKCLPILTWMLQGLEVTPPIDSEVSSNKISVPKIIFENKHFCVIDKPAGVLSVRGKSAKISVEDWLLEKYGESKKVKVAHRLDQDTSGLILATFGDASYKIMQSLFSSRRIKKVYYADLEGNYKINDLSRKGSVNLPIIADIFDRPRQKVDYEHGKEAITEYEFIEVKDGISRVRFNPLTGRTHQLRVHSASAEGLNMPIVGDRIYGVRKGDTQRLHLHAQRLEFTFPIDNKRYIFESEIPFKS